MYNLYYAGPYTIKVTNTRGDIEIRYTDDNVVVVYDEGWNTVTPYALIEEYITLKEDVEDLKRIVKKMQEEIC